METESYLCVERKLYRAKEHFEELASRVRDYYKSNPGKVEVTPKADGGASVKFIENKPTPVRFGLIFGDFLQCLRSALDYLVWELVRSAGADGTYKHEFPVTDSEEAFNRALERGTLTKVPEAAVTLIESYQPFHHPYNAKSHFLAVLNRLANINKHRRVLITILAASIGHRPAEFPHIRTRVTRVAEDGSTADFEVWSCLRIGEEHLPPMDILTVCEALFEDTYQFIQKFKPFLT